MISLLLYLEVQKEISKLPGIQFLLCEIIFEKLRSISKTLENILIQIEGEHSGNVSRSAFMKKKNN